MRELQEKILELANKYSINKSDINEIFGFKKTSDAVGKGIRNGGIYLNLERLKTLTNILTPEKIDELDKKYDKTKKNFELFSIDLNQYLTMLEMEMLLSRIKYFLPSCSPKYKEEFRTKCDAIFKKSVMPTTQSFWLVPDTSLLKEGLVELLSSPIKFTHLQILVFKKSVPIAKEIIQDWATSDKGNFDDDLIIQLMGHNNRFLVEILAFNQDDSWDGVVETDEESSNYAPLSEIGAQYLVNEIEDQSSNEVSWSLPESPEVRILGALKKDDQIIKNQAALEFLSEHIDYTEKQGQIGSENSWKNVAALISNEANTELSGELQRGLNELKLRVS